MKKIGLEIEIKGEKKTLDTFEKFTQAEKELREELEKAPLGSKQFKQLQEDLEQVQDGFDKARIEAGDLSGVLSDIPGPIGSIASGFGGAIKSVKAFGIAAKTAIITNPIGAVLTVIVGALTAVGKAFLSTKKGAETLEKAQAGLNAILDVFRDVLVTIGENLMSLFDDPVQSLKDFGKLIVDNIITRFEGILELIPNLSKAIGEVFKGNFSEAGKIATDALGKVVVGVENVSDKVADAASAVQDVFNEALEEAGEASSLTGLLQEITDKERELAVARSEQNKELQKNKLLVEDTTKSTEERLKALDDVSAKEQEILEQELELERQRLSALEALAAQSDSDQETLDELAAQRIKLNQLEQDSFAKQTEIAAKRKALLGEQEADEKEAAAEKERLAKEAEEREEERLRKEEERRKAEYERAVADADAELELLRLKEDTKTEDLIAALEKRLELELENAELSDAQRLLIKEKFNQRVKEIEEQQTQQLKEETDKRIALQRSEVQATANALGQVSKLLGEETEAGKAAAVAQALLNTYLGASDALTDKTIPNTFVRIAAVASVIATGLAQVRAINNTSTDVPKFSEGGLVSGQGTSTSDSIPAMLSNGESVINARSTAMFGGLLSAINEAGGGKRFNAGGLVSQTPQNASVQPLNNFLSQPLRAYVVSSEVTSQQQLDRTLKNNATL